MWNEEPIVDTFVNQLRENSHEVSLDPEGGVAKVSDDQVAQQVDAMNYKDIVGASNSNNNVEVSMNRKQRKNRLLPSLIDLKRVARLSEKDRNALIRPLKSF